MHNFQRPKLPYNNESLPNSNYFYDVTVRTKRPPTAKMFDAQNNYLIDSLNILDQDIENIEAGIIPGLNDPNNIYKVLSSDGDTGVLTLITGNNVEVNSIPGDRIINGSINTDQYNDGSITLGKLFIEDDTFPSEKILFQDNKTDGKFIKDATLNGLKVIDATLPGTKLVDATLPGTKLVDATLPGTKLIDLTIALSKLAAEVTNCLVPIGTVISYAGAVAPSANYVECIGQNINRATYASLFAVIGTTFGPGDGATTFALPDIRGRSQVGIGSDNTTGGRIVVTSQVPTLALGGTFGEQSHQLTVNELPTHNHGINFYANGFVGSNVPVFGNTAGNPSTTGNTGGDQPHNTMPPGIFLRFYIRAL